MPAEPLWSLALPGALAGARTTPAGLSAGEAARRLAEHGNVLHPRSRWRSRLALLLGQFNSPIVWLLAIAAALSFALRDRTDATLIFGIVLASGLLGFWHEAGAADAVEGLLALVRTHARVLRDGEPRDLPLGEVVVGDVVVLAAGDAVPGDGRLLEARDLFVNEAALTGESFPAEKAVCEVPADAPPADRSNALFQGTYVVSGEARMVVLALGEDTALGRIAGRLATPAPTEFEHGLRRFGAFLMEVTLLLVLAIFAINVYLARPVLEALLFSLALAVGLTPQLLPAIVSVNLAKGARRMAEAKVIVKRLSAIENIGAMDVLCSDKTGTLTAGVVTLSASLDALGAPSARVQALAYLNARFETGMANALDAAICAAGGHVGAATKLDEVPYDFTRKRLTVLVEDAGCRTMITKGALENVLAACSQVALPGGPAPIGPDLARLREQLVAFSQDGYRVLGVATRGWEGDRLTPAAERDMVFEGFLLFYDPPKPGAGEAIGTLAGLGVRLVMITGDNRHAAAHVAASLGLGEGEVLAGSELDALTTEALVARVERTRVYAEIEPGQKERIVLALRQAGHVVGYLGDGINDGPALHAADVGISVNTAADVAKEAAAIVLLEQDLRVLASGVRAGRLTFANTMKYVFMATSANFGNMFSMAGASIFLPFFPLLPGQILLANVLTDLPEMAIANDAVDPAWLARPRRWDIGFIRRFMVAFGLLSSCFDFITFAVLARGLHAPAPAFQAGWFVESVASASLAVLVIRTRLPAYRSRPAPLLLQATLIVTAVAAALPLLPLGSVFEFGVLPPAYLAALVPILVAYLAAAELLKRAFYRREGP